MNDVARLMGFDRHPMLEQFLVADADPGIIADYLEERGDEERSKAVRVCKDVNEVRFALAFKMTPAQLREKVVLFQKLLSESFHDFSQTMVTVIQDVSDAFRSLGFNQGRYVAWTSNMPISYMTPNEVRALRLPGGVE